MKHILLFIILCPACFIALAQDSSRESKGDKAFERFAYHLAAEHYTAAKSLSARGKRNLATSYFNTGNFEASEKTFASFINSESATPEDYFNYASILRINGNYEASGEWFEKFHAAVPGDRRGKHFRDGSGQLEKLKSDEGRYRIFTLNINSPYQDFGAAFYGENVVFVSARRRTEAVRRIYNWNNQPFLDLHIATLENNQPVNVKKFHSGINRKMHEGPASFSGDGNLMAFARNNYSAKSKQGSVNLEIYFMIKNEAGGWSKPFPFRLNSPEYSVGHPWLSKDGTAMYFASDMPGGIGGTDLYRIQKKSDGKWGEPINLGDAVNTEANEMFPFYDEKNELLFFSGNGHYGLGGLDIFVSKKEAGGNFNRIRNAGHPLNTRFDDFAFTLDSNARQGFFSSNRAGGKGDDDIYGFELLKPFVFDKMIKGVVKDTAGDLLPGAEVQLFDDKGNLLETATASESGAFEFSVEPGARFDLHGRKEKYFDEKKSVSAATDEYEIIADLILEKDPGISLRALITDVKTKLPLEGVKVSLLDNMTGKPFDNFITSSAGDFRKALPGKKINERLSYSIKLVKEGYLTKNIVFNHQINSEGQISMHQLIDLSMEKPEVGGDLAKMIDLNPIYFDLGKYNIRKDAAVELDKIAEVMNEYQNMVVALGSHTDCRGSMASNQTLSENRARSSAEYIKKRITNPERITGKGYGETKLLNDCACEGAVKSACAEEQHQLNRRTEFVIIKLE